jgi:hypothetical protein
MASSEPAPRSAHPPPPDDVPPPDDARDAPERRALPLDPAALPPPISRRRGAALAASIVAVLVVLAFGRQVGDASAASARAADLRDANAALRDQLSAIQADLSRVQGDPYIGIAGRAYGLGKRHEVPFTLAADAPPLPSDAPGSAALRVGGDVDQRSPWEAWLDLLLGPGA